MSDSAPPHRKTPAQGPPEPTSGAEGLWGLDLWNGSAWFSDWVYVRLQWPPHVKRKRLDDLRPNLAAEGWDALLLQIRAHLEAKAPLALEIRVQLPSGQFEWWRVLASAEHNTGGQPVYLAGSLRDISAERDPRAP
jgi:PAS domain-containing protein